MNAVTQLAPDEPLSPELVLVLPAEVRARVLAALGPPVWATPRRPDHSAAPALAEPVAPAVGRLVLARFAQLALIFVAVTLVTLAMSLVAHAVH